jgi:hypothetical protein
MEMSGQLHTLDALPAGKQPLVPIAQVGGWAPELVWVLRKRDKSCSYLELNRLLGGTADNIVTIPTSHGFENWSAT